MVMTTKARSADAADSSCSSTTTTTTTCSTSSTRTPSSFPRNEEGQAVTHIGGLEYYPNFLSPQEQIELLSLVDAQPWQSGIIARRQQFYGDVYYHTTFKSKELQPAATEHKDATRGISLQESGMEDWLEKTRPFFESVRQEYPHQNIPTILPTQVLINEYRNNMGISSHFEDIHAFGPIIVTISLIQPIYMTLKRPVQKTNACEEYTDVVKVLLEPGSLLVMKDQARYDYRHGIGKAKWVNIPNTEDAEHDSQGSNHYKQRIRRDDSYRRVSLTIRHLLPTRRKVTEEDDELDTIKDPVSY